MSSAQSGERVERVPIEAVVDEQVRAWESARDQPHRPVITISRQYGACGAEIGRAVARRTGFDFWDQEVVHRIADDAHLPAAMFVSLDEHRRDEVQELMSQFGGASSDDYLRGLLRVVHTIADYGRAEIVGRGAHYALGEKQALKVRIVRSLTRRVEHISDSTGLDHSDALAHIRSTDEDRRAFTKYHFDRDGEDPADYDLVVNSGSLGIEASAELIVGAYRCLFDAPGDGLNSESSRPT